MLIELAIPCVAVERMKYCFSVTQVFISTWDSSVTKERCHVHQITSTRMTKDTCVGSR